MLFPFGVRGSIYYIIIKVLFLISAVCIGLSKDYINLSTKIRRKKECFMGRMIMNESFHTVFNFSIHQMSFFIFVTKFGW